MKKLNNKIYYFGNNNNIFCIIMSKKEEKEKQEIEIIKNYAKNCGFKECKTWCEVSECFSELRRKNNALMRNLPQDSSWETINDYDEYYNNNSYFYNNNKHRKIDLVPEKIYTSYYYNTCD